MEKKDIQAKPFSNMEVSAFCGQIALILKSGISSIEGITIMMEDAPEGEEKNILEFILERMQESGNLYESLSKTGLFPSYMLHMVEIGEETGTLDEVMEALSNHYDREDAIGKSIKNAVTYPLIMAGIHLAFAFPMVHKLLLLFSLTNLKLLLIVTVCCYLVFAVFYMMVYRITSKGYYHIVSMWAEKK